MDTLRNESDHEFTDISSEQYRVYQTPFGTKRIDNPLSLAVTPIGHRVLDAQGISHYIDISKGFFLEWKAKEGKPHFVK
jgi:uncharacterized membrane protein